MTTFRGTSDLVRLFAMTRDYRERERERERESSTWGTLDFARLFMMMCDPTHIYYYIHAYIAWTVFAVCD